MSMIIEKLIGLAIVCAVVIVLLRSSRPEQAMILSIVSGVILLICLLNVMEPIIAEIQSLMTLLTFDSLHGETLLKCLGLCLLTQSAADVCRDAGEQSIANYVELAGKTAVLLLCLPLFRQLLALTENLMN